jgi:hypothetical protein
VRFAFDFVDALNPGVLCFVSLTRLRCGERDLTVVDINGRWYLFTKATMFSPHQIIKRAFLDAHQKTNSTQRK